MEEEKVFKVKEFSTAVYEGDLVDGVQDGFGCQFWDTGEFYSGQWCHGKFEGEGIFFFAYGGYMIGNFKNSKIHGHAVLKFPNKNVYVGKWRKGKLQGKSLKYTTSEHCWSIGVYENGQLQHRELDKQMGVPPYSNNPTSQFTPQIEKAIFEDNFLEIRIFLQKRNNFDHYLDSLTANHIIQERRISFIKFSKTDYYFGVTKFKHGRYQKEQIDNPQGLGLMYGAGGMIKKGFWNGGTIQGVGSFIYPNLDIYHGSIKNNQLDGEGVYYKKSRNCWNYGFFQKNNLRPQVQGQGYPLDVIQKFRAKYRTNKVWGKVKNLIKFMNKTGSLLKNFNFSSSKSKNHNKNNLQITIPKPKPEVNKSFSNDPDFFSKSFFEAEFPNDAPPLKQSPYEKLQEVQYTFENRGQRSTGRLKQTFTFDEQRQPSQIEYQETISISGYSGSEMRVVKQKDRERISQMKTEAKLQEGNDFLRKGQLQESIAPLFV